MDITINPLKLQGAVAAIPSKSQAHRLLICAAFANKTTVLKCPDTNADIEATAACLNALGAAIRRTQEGYSVSPITQVPQRAVLPCGESGSTLRFMLPVAGALGVDTLFQMEGRLPQRPLSPLWEEMERMGCTLSRPDSNTLRCTGKLRSGTFTIDGGVSSQFITGLLFASALLDGSSVIQITGKLESKPYITMTQQALARFHVCTDEFRIKGKQTFRSPGQLQVEGDWSNAAFFLAAQAIGNEITVTNLDQNSAQGDRAVSQLLPLLNSHQTISAADIPDLVPILSVTAAAKQGAVFTDIQRLRLKESDRVESTVAMLHNLGICAYATENALTVEPGSFTGGTVDSVNDHRIAMAAAIAATLASEPVTILGAECVKKSYPRFWEIYKALGGQYELKLR